MSRKIINTNHGPHQVDTDGSPIFVCACGLSRNEKGICDGSHHKTKDEEEGKTYIYDDKLERKEVCADCGKDECNCNQKEKCECDCCNH